MQTLLSPQEIAARGKALYAGKIQVQVEPQHLNDFLMVDVQSGDYEVDSDDMAAEERLLARRPQSSIKCVSLPLPHILWGTERRQPKGISRMSVTLSHIQSAVKATGLSGKPVCLHASLRSFGWVEGGAQAVIGAFLAEGCTVLVFTLSFNSFPHRR